MARTTPDRASPARRRAAALAFGALVLLGLAWARPAAADDAASRLVALLDYVGGDYKNSVQGGRVVSEPEYREMKEFAVRIGELGGQLQPDARAEIEPALKQVTAAIERKADALEVAELARAVKDKLVARYGIATHPRRMPTLQAGQKIFAENCAQCHGAAGRGDGPGRASMNPKEPPPADFTDATLMEGLSPFKAFNVASFGVEGTAMPNFSALSEEERWQAAFYVLSLRFTDQEAAEGAGLARAAKFPRALAELPTLATATDAELAGKLKTAFPEEGKSRPALAYLRRGLLEKDQSQAHLAAAQTMLKESLSLYEKGDKGGAYQKAADAYLDAFDQVEVDLFAKDMSFGRALEDEFTQFRNAVRRGDDVREIRRLYDHLSAGLDRAGQILAGRESLNQDYLFFNAMLIILREGLEVALILAAMLALLKVMGQAAAMRYIHLGWILAVLAGFATWALAQTFLTISGANRESFEGFTTLTAAVVLFYVGYWLHTKSEAQKWHQFIREKVEGALSKKRLLALAGVSFFAAYREAFEVVLFYQALWLQSASNPKPVLTGFLAGVALLGVLVFVLFKLGLKMPIKYFFGGAGLLLYLLALVFAGQGVRTLQATGWFSVTPVRFPPQVSALGIYPTVETLAAQAVVLFALVATTLWPNRPRFSAPKGSRGEVV